MDMDYGVIVQLLFFFTKLITSITTKINCINCEEKRMFHNQSFIMIKEIIKGYIDLTKVTLKFICITANYYMLPNAPFLSFLFAYS